MSLMSLTPATSGRTIYPYLSARYSPIYSESPSAGIGAAETAALFPPCHLSLGEMVPPSLLPIQNRH